MPEANLHRNHRPFDLVRTFLIAASVILLSGMGVMGLWVSERIEEAASRKAAVIAALYVDGVVAPYAQTLLRPGGDTTEARARLDASMARGLMSRQLMAFKIWNLDGMVVYSPAPLPEVETVDREALLVARSGQVYSELKAAGDSEAVGSLARQVPLLEVYAPVRAAGTGQVIGVVEFYDDATALQVELQDARSDSWILVGMVTLTMLSILFVVIARGGRLIDSQRLLLQDQVLKLSTLLDQNRELARTVDASNRRAADLNERFLRRLSADIHDGPLQLLAFASLRLSDRTSAEEHNGSSEGREAVVGAMTELRQICRGLTLPEIEGLDTAAVIRRAVQAHERQTGRTIPLLMPVELPALPNAENICLYRVIQEGLNNAERHAEGRGADIEVCRVDETLVVRVRDSGKGFNVRTDEHGLGLQGLRERVIGLGGEFHVTATSAEGTVITVQLAIPFT
ncbi:MAG: histidine kinase [Alphaproteobacteria bacterium]|nr:MAG: histidine kinase [Alphaproteobacteria bacterium]PZO34902.1 MAG: histidine kinase [Alphaproteobacteria bacterium]